MIFIPLDLIRESELVLQETLYLPTTIPNVMQYGNAFTRELFYERTNDTYYPIIEYIPRNILGFTREEYKSYKLNGGGPLIKEIEKIIETSLFKRGYDHIIFFPAYANGQFILIKRDQDMEIIKGMELEKTLIAKGYKKVTTVEPQEILNEFAELNVKEAIEVFTGKKLRYIETIVHDVEEIKNRLSFSQKQLDEFLQREASDGKIEITEEKINIKLNLSENKIKQLQEKFRYGYIGLYKVYFSNTTSIELTLELNGFEKEYIAQYINKIDLKLTEEIIKRLF